MVGGYDATLRQVRTATTARRDRRLFRSRVKFLHLVTQKRLLVQVSQ